MNQAYRSSLYILEIRLSLEELQDWQRPKSFQFGALTHPRQRFSPGLHVLILASNASLVRIEKCGVDSLFDSGDPQLQCRQQGQLFARMLGRTTRDHFD